jgi:AcrR family transcriptional regulator
MGSRKRAAIARRTPKQARAVATRAAVFEAVAQILEREGEGALNTNRIADRAGVSVGTLYQYFPNKTAILVAMAKTEMAAIASDSARSAARARSREESVRASIRRFIRVFEDRPATRRAVVKAVIAAESGAALGAEIERTSRALPALSGASRLDAFILTRAVVGVVRAAVLEGYADLRTQRFEDALMRLVSAYETASRRA